jgi:hypothetical protein
MVRGNGRCPARDFMDAQNQRERAKLTALFERFSDHGPPHKERFKKVEGNIHAFKSYQIRVFCAYAPGYRVILLYGLIKKRDRYKSREIKKAKRLLQEWISQQGGDVG